MKRIGRRANAVFLLVLLLVAGLSFFVTEYVMNSRQWVMTQGNPHVYSGENMECGQVVDLEGLLLLDMDHNRVYAKTQEIRMSTMHWLGDRQGNIQALVIPHYAQQMVGYNPVTGI